MAQLAALLPVVLVACAAAQASISGSCHADVLINNVQESALSGDEVENICRIAAQKIASETGHEPGDVMTRVFPGDYNAPWSPTKKRPPADMFLASTIQNCRSAKVVLGIFRGPQFNQDLLEALKPVVQASPAVKGQLTVLGVSVIPATMDASALPPAPGSEGSSSSMGWLWAIIGMAALGGVGFFAMKKMKEGQDEGSEEEGGPFTGH